MRRGVRGAGGGLRGLAWRDGRVNWGVRGRGARATCPTTRRAIIAPPAADGGGGDADAGERALSLARRTIERRVAEAGGGPGGGLDSCFVCSPSCRTLGYKALLTGTELRAFFPDLRSPDYETALAGFHQRHSTHTSPRRAPAPP